MKIYARAHLSRLNAGLAEFFVSQGVRLSVHGDYATDSHLADMVRLCRTGCGLEVDPVLRWLPEGKNIVSLRPEHIETMFVETGTRIAKILAAGLEPDFVEVMAEPVAWNLHKFHYAARKAAILFAEIHGFLRGLVPDAAIAWYSELQQELRRTKFMGKPYYLRHWSWPADAPVYENGIVLYRVGSQAETAAAVDIVSQNVQGRPWGAWIGLGCWSDQGVWHTGADETLDPAAYRALGSLLAGHHPAWIYLYYERASDADLKRQCTALMEGLAQ